MKFISVLILFVCTTAATFSKWLLIASFDFNESYIAQELCVNKNNPSSHCKGHCFLNKQLNNEEKPNTPFNTSSKEKFAIQLFCIETPGNIDLASVYTKPVYNSLLQFTGQHVMHSIFHPPCAV